MRVYRFENEAGVGPYQGMIGTPYKACLQAHQPGGSEANTHPSVRCDIFEFNPPMLSALSSVDALRRWFKDCVEQLEEARFLVSVYAVPALQVLEGCLRHGQVAFRPRNGERIWRSSFLELTPWEMRDGCGY